MTYILSHDLGTTGNKATLFSDTGTVCASGFSPYPTHYPRAGWAEQDADDYWQAFCTATRDLLAASKVEPGEVGAVAFSAQMMAALPIGRDGFPLRRSIIWSDMRSSSQASQLEEMVGGRDVYRITGHRLSPSYTATKAMWIRENEPEVFASTSVFLQAKDYVIFRLTGRAVTDYSDATGTNLFDVNTMEWSEEILRAAGIGKEKFPEAVSGDTVAGGITAAAAGKCGLAEGTPVVVGGGDGACATYGSGITDSTEAYLCLGTSSWIATSVVGPVIDEEMRIGNFALFEKGKFMPAGSMNAGGGALKWFVDSVLTGEEDTDYDDLIFKASQVAPGARGLLFLPYLMGERSPLWNHNARGTFMGLSMVHGRNEMIRAILEGVAYHIRSIYDVFLDNGIDPEALRILGGGARSEVWCSIIGEVLGKPISLLNVVDEATSVGAAMAGGVGIGLFSSFRDAAAAIKKTKEIEPEKKNTATYDRYYPIFRKTYERLKDVYDMMGEV